MEQVLKIVREARGLGINLTEDNFCTPIRKIVKVNLTASEKWYNDHFSGHRSAIESLFREIVELF